MRILKKHIDWKKKLMHVKLDLEENSDDIWNVFNIIGVGDIVYATCRRRVSKENAVGMTKQEVRVFNAYIRVQVRKYKHDIYL